MTQCTSSARARLTGVKEIPGALVGTSLIFILEDVDGRILEIDQTLILYAIRLAELAHILPCHGANWWGSLDFEQRTYDASKVSLTLPRRENRSILKLPDFAATYDVKINNGSNNFEVPLTAILQCLYIAEPKCLVPSIDGIWKAECFPFSIRLPATLLATERL